MDNIRNSIPCMYLFQMYRVSTISRANQSHWVLLCIYLTLIHLQAANYVLRNRKIHNASNFVILSAAIGIRAPGLWHVSSCKFLAVKMANSDRVKRCPVICHNRDLSSERLRELRFAHHCLGKYQGKILFQSEKFIVDEIGYPKELDMPRSDLRSCTTL